MGSSGSAGSSVLPLSFGSRFQAWPSCQSMVRFHSLAPDLDTKIKIDYDDDS